MFPWKSLLSHLASHGFVLKNWLADVLFLGEERRGKGSRKGISDLTSPECSKLVAALTDTSDSKLYLQHVPNLKGMSSFFTINDANVAIVALITSKSPVIISAPPLHDSALSKGKHMFCNLAIDYLGPSRLSDLSAMHIKRTKSRKVATIDVDIGESGINDSNGVEEAPSHKYSKSATTSVTKLLGVYPPQWSSKKKAMATSSVITLSSGSMSETKLSGDDYVPGQESRGVNSDADMEDGEVASKTNTIRDVDSEYEQEPSSCKRKVKGPEVGGAKQKSSIPPLDSRGQTSKRSKTVTFKDLKAHTTGTKHRHILSSCQNRFSLTVLLEGPGGQGANEDISPDTSGC